MKMQTEYVIRVGELFVQTMISYVETHVTLTSSQGHAQRFTSRNMDDLSNNIKSLQLANVPFKIFEIGGSVVTEAQPEALVAAIEDQGRKTIGIERT